MSIKFDFESHDNTILINYLESENLEYKTLDKSDSSLESLTNIFNTTTNDNVALYGDGTHGELARINGKLELWGARAESQNPLRCFFVYEKDTAEPIGFVNIGVSTVKLGGESLYEGGFLFNHAFNNSSLVSEALDSIYIDYTNTLYQAGVLTAPGFIYTISKDNLLHSALDNSKLEELSLASENPQSISLIEVLKEGKRFNVDSENQQIFDGNRAVDVFYTFFENKAENLIEAVENAGVVTDIATDEL